MTTTDKVSIVSKRQLADWLAANGIQVVGVKQKRGSLYFQPVLPPKVAGVGVIHKATIGLSRSPGLLTDHGYSHTGERYVGSQRFPIAPEEVAIQDAYVSRLNEINELVIEGLAGRVYLTTNITSV